MFRTYLWSLSVVFNYYIVGLTIPHMKELQPAYLLYRLSLLSKKNWTKYCWCRICKTGNQVLI